MKKGMLLGLLCGLLSAATAAAPNLEFVAGPKGAPEEVGAAFVRALGPAAAALTAQRDQLFARHPADKRREMLEHYLVPVEKYAPNWIEECRAVSRALGWPDDDYAMYNLLVDDKLGCTSWIVTPEAGADRRMMLHKNRDYSGTHLAAFSRQSAGFYRWLFIGERWSWAPRFAVNEKGFAIVMNAGDTNTDRRGVGLKAPDTLMLLAERCATVTEGVAMIERLVKDGDYADEGTIYLLIDPKAAAIVECSPQHVVSTPVPFGFELRTNSWKLAGMTSISTNPPSMMLIENRREYLIRHRLRQAKASDGGIGLEEIWALSRSREGALYHGLEPVCRNATISGATFVPDAEFPDVLTTVYLALGPVRNCVYLPIPLAARELPRFFFNGEWGDRAFAIRDQLGIDHDELPRFQALEKELLREFNRTAEQARMLLRQGKKAAAIRLLNENFQKQAQETWDFLFNFAQP
jgi:hypothetical protein